MDVFEQFAEKQKGMKKKEKLQTGNDTLPLLKTLYSKDYATRMGQLLKFLQQTNELLTGAEIVQDNITMDKDGTILDYIQVKGDYTGILMSDFSKKDPELKEVAAKRSAAKAEICEIYRKKQDQHTIIRRKNTEDKKDKAREVIADLEEKLKDPDKRYKELNQLHNDLLEIEEERLKKTDFDIDLMRKKLELFTGVKVLVKLKTGEYRFPLIKGNPFYRAVCAMLGLPFDKIEIEKPVITRSYKMPKEILADFAKAVKFTSTDDLRPSMMCVCLEIRKNKAQLVSTDAHRLYLSRKYKIEGFEESRDYLIPASELKNISTKDDTFSFYVYKDGTASMLGKKLHLTDAKFPDWKVVVPEYKTGVEFNRLDFIAAVKTIIPYTNRSTCQVTIGINGNLQFAAQDIDFSFEGGTIMKYEKKDMPDTVIGFNGKFLVETMKTFKSENVTMLSEGAATKAGIFTDGVDKVLIMPLMIGD